MLKIKEFILGISSSRNEEKTGQNVSLNQNVENSSRKKTEGCEALRIEESADKTIDSFSFLGDAAETNKEKANINVTENPALDITRLYKDLCNLIKEFDIVLSKEVDDETVNIIEMCQYRLIEILSKNGVTLIDSEVEFNPSLHIPVPFSIVEQGIPIKAINRPGIRIGDAVYLKALVTI